MASALKYKTTNTGRSGDLVSMHWLESDFVDNPKSFVEGNRITHLGLIRHPKLHPNILP